MTTRITTEIKNRGIVTLDLFHHLVDVFFLQNKRRYLTNYEFLTLFVILYFCERHGLPLTEQGSKVGLQNLSLELKVTQASIRVFQNQVYNGARPQQIVPILNFP